MIDHLQLLELARELATRKAPGAPKKVYLRRSISTVYYGLFHFLVARATCNLVGQDRNSARFCLVYRSFQHSEMRLACEQAGKQLPPEFAIKHFCSELRLCASTFVELQKLRHEADYDPQARITLFDTQNAIARAEVAVEKLDAAPIDERDLFLLTLRYRLRS
jgi:uncharacterized protein (UPF0332 family)